MRIYIYIYIYVHIDGYRHDDCQGLWSFVVNLEFRTNICMSCTLFQGWCQWYAHSCDRGSWFSSGHVAKGELKSLDAFPKRGAAQAWTLQAYDPPNLTASFERNARRKRCPGDC